MAVKVTAHKSISLCSIYLPPKVYFDPKDLQDLIEQFPPPFILIDCNGHHTLWECEEVNNRAKQLEDLILKNYLIFFQ